MPIMKYNCLDCGKEFSKIFFSDGHAPRSCTVCGSENIVGAGSTFKEDEALAKRVLCASCDSCSDSNASPVRPSS